MMNSASSRTVQYGGGREALLEATVRVVARAGLRKVTNRVVAEEAGVTHGLVSHHFGTRDALLRETLRRARQRQRDFFGELVSPRPDEPYLSTLRRAWRVMTGPAGRPYLSMFGKLRENAEQRLWPGFRREATTDWLQPLEDGMRSIGRAELATLVLAVVRGLIMDIEATGDVPRCDQAFDDFLAALTPVTARGSRVVLAESADTPAT